jgi:hypothetical protein
VVDATLVVLPGAGHLSNLEQPGLFNAAVRTFCGAPATRASAELEELERLVPLGSSFKVRAEGPTGENGQSNGTQPATQGRDQ